MQMAKPSNKNKKGTAQTPSQPRSLGGKALDWIKKEYKFAVTILVFIGGIFTIFEKINSVKEFIKDDHQKFVDRTITPPCQLVNLNSFSKLRVQVGASLTFEAPTLQEGIVDPFTGYAEKDSLTGQIEPDAPLHFRVRIVNGNVFLSFTIFDLKTGAIIAQLVDNEWWVFNLRSNDYHCDGQSIEIIDQYGYVAFQLWLDENQIIQIRGYFVGRHSTSFANDDIKATYVREDAPGKELRKVDYASLVKPKYLRGLSD